MYKADRLLNGSIERKRRGINTVQMLHKLHKIAT